MAKYLPLLQTLNASRITPMKTRAKDEEPKAVKADNMRRALTA